MAGGAPPADVRAPGGGTRAPAGERAADVSGQLHCSPRSDDAPQERRHQIGRLPPHLRHVDDPRRALLHVDRRLPPLRAH